MLGSHAPLATVAVSDLSRARHFYESTLGLQSVHLEGGEAINYAAGGAQLLVYRSQFAGTNKATAITWLVGDDLEQIVNALEGRGVKFEHYDMPGVKRQGHIHGGSGPSAAWFKDPDGNIHALVNG